MSIQTVPLATLQKIRQHLQTALKPPSQAVPSSAEDPPPPDSIVALGDLFAQGFDARPQTGWRLSAIDVGIVFDKLPGLTLQPEYRLVSYLWQDDRGSRGQVWAVPSDRATTAELEQAIAAADADRPPQPAYALPDLLLAVTGDRSPGSFLIASLLRRELHHWGRTRAYCDWSHHHLIDQVPIAYQSSKAAQLSNLSPRLRRLPDGRVAVEFFTCYPALAQISRHIDLYSATRYTANSLDRSIA